MYVCRRGTRCFVVLDHISFVPAETIYESLLSRMDMRSIARGASVAN